MSADRARRRMEITAPTDEQASPQQMWVIGNFLLFFRELGKGCMVSIHEFFLLSRPTFFVGFFCEKLLVHSLLERLVKGFFRNIP
jgi:hypothetical protein